MQAPTTSGSGRTTVAQGATFAVTVLTAMNLLNYLDRYVPSAVKDLFKKDLNLTDAQTSLPLTSFVFIYMLASPVFGSLADRWPRRVLIASGVALWSLATASAALATGFLTFLLARSLVGVGEAAYATLAPALLGDFYPENRRNRILTVFYTAIPVGAALGYKIGGSVGQIYGWRVAFLICGLPGLLVAVLALMIRDPGSLKEDGPTLIRWPDALRMLKRNRAFLVAVGGYTAVTFAAGGMADWLPTFLSRHRGMDLAEAGGLVGTVTCIGGLAGTATGGFLADAIRGRTRQPYLALSALSLIPATGFAVAALLVRGTVLIGLCLGVAQFFLWFYNGPINTVILNSVPGAVVAKAFSLSILLIHLLGDAISPTIIGALSDRITLPKALAVVPAAMAVGCVIWMAGWRLLAEKGGESGESSLAPTASPGQ